MEPAPRRRTAAVLSAAATDEHLVDAVGNGSQLAFEAIFDRHHRSVLAFCRQMLGSAHEAEDATQHTFLAAYRHLAHAEPPQALRPWLYAIARHRCLTALRDRREHPVAQLPERVADQLVRDVTAREDLRELLVDLGRLPKEQRAALVLAELGDLPHDEIADLLGCPRAKVKALVFQARTSLSAEREARATSCAEIRAQLSVLRGGALLRATLRRHLRDCPECRAFRDDVRPRRSGRALVLAPWLALRHGLALLGPGAEAAGGLGVGGVVATALVTVAVPLGAPHVVGDGDRATAAPRSAPAQPTVRDRPLARVTTRVRRSTAAHAHRATPAAGAPAHARPSRVTVSTPAHTPVTPPAASPPPPSPPAASKPAHAHASPPAPSKPARAPPSPPAATQPARTHPSPPPARAHASPPPAERKPQTPNPQGGAPDPAAPSETAAGPPAARGPR